MRIRIKSGAKNINLVLPTKLIFSAPVAWLGFVVGRTYVPDAMTNIPPEAMQAIFRELRNTKERYGSWDLVEVSSASGEQVLIRL